MRAPVTAQGSRPLSKSDEGGPRKGKRASPLKATKLKKSKDKQKNPRLRSPGPSIRKSQSSGADSSTKEEPLAKLLAMVTPTKGQLKEGSPSPLKSSSKKRSASAGSSKALNDVVNDLHLKLESSTKKEERGRTPKKSPSKPVKSVKSSSEKSLPGESSPLKFKRSSEKSPSGERASPKPKKALEKSPSRESSLSKKSLEKSISENCTLQKPKKSSEKSPSRESSLTKKSLEKSPSKESLSSKKSIEKSISEDCASQKLKKSPEKSSSRESSLSKVKRWPEKVLSDEGVPSKLKTSTSNKSTSRETCSPKRNRKAFGGEQLKQKETERDLLEAKKQRIAKCIEAVIIRYSRELVSTVVPVVSEEVCAKPPLKVKTIKEEMKGEGDVIPKRCRGRPKGSKNKVKKEKDGTKVKEKVKLEKGKKKLSSGKKTVDEETPALGSDPAKVLEDPKGKRKLPKGLHKPLKKKHKKVLSSKVLKAKGLKPKGVKNLASPQSRIIPLKERESSESETDTKKSLKGKHKPSKPKPIEENASEADTKVKMKKPLKRKKSSSGPSPKSKVGKSVSFTKSEKSASPKKEIEFFYDFSDQEEEMPSKPLKKALQEKWSHELKKSVKNEGHDGKKGKGVYLGRRREHPHVCYEEESDRESEVEDLYPKKVKKEVRAPGRKRKRKKSIKEDSEDDPPAPTVPRSERSPRMARLNAIAMMAIMNEDAKVPLPFSQESTSNSMALVVRESTIARRHSGDESEDSEDDYDRGYSPSRRPGKRKPESDSKGVNAKKRMRRKGELGVPMDMKDMIVSKRMASLNASAIMAASFCSESRTKRNVHHSSGASEVTKISYKATKKQNLKTRSVITVQETTKKVKKAQGDASTEVEEHIIVKKKVRQSGMHVEEVPDTDREATDTDNEILPKSPDDSGVIMESTTITYVTTQTHTVPQTVTLSGVKEYSVSTSNGKTTTMMQQVQRKSVTTTCTTGPPSSTAAVPTALIPPTPHVQVAQEETRNQGSRVSPNYSPLGALEVMRPVMHQHPQPPPPPPPPPPVPHFIPYAHTHHVPPVPHPHYHHPVPPPPSVNIHHHHMLPHQPSSPYPPLSPHSPPYPPPSSSSSSSTSSSPACPSSTSPSTTPHPHPSPSSCHSTAGYRSPAPCSPNFPPPVSSPKQGPPQGVPPSYRDDRPHPSPMSSPNGLIERHSSAFSAPTPSIHSPASGTSHGYQPVSGPIPTGGSPNAGTYKPPQGSPGGSSVAQPTPPYSSPSRLTSPPPPPPPNKPHYPPNDHYPGGPHSYQSYPYQGTSPYDKYYSRNPSSYHMYQPSFPPPGGQYPPPGEYGYQPPPSGTVHYSQESYTSYTLCVPAPPPPPPHGSPPNAVTHSSALALPPPPPPTSNAPHHHPNAPYTTYHCTEYAPVFPYPPPGSSPQNAVCCPAGGPKNVSSGPLTASGKGPESSDCNARKQLPGPSGPNPCNNYQYYGGVPPSKNQNPHMVVPGSSHGSLQHQVPPPAESHMSQRQPRQAPPHPHQHSYMSQQEAMVKDLRHPSFNESSSSLGRSNVPKSQKDKLTPQGVDVGLAPHTGAPALVTSVPKPSPGECKESRNLNTIGKAPTATSTVTLPTTSLSVATTLPSSGVSMTSTSTTSSVSTSFATGTPSVKSICSSTLSLSVATTSASSVGAPAVPTAPSLSSTNSTSTSMNTPLLAIATSLPPMSPPLPPPPPPPDVRASVAPAGDKKILKHGNSDMHTNPLPLNNARQARTEEDKSNSAKVDTSSASSANEALIPLFPTSSAPLKTTTWVVQPSASTPTQPPSSQNPRVLHLSPTNTTISVSLSNTNSSTNSVMSTTAPVLATLEKVASTKTMVVSEKPSPSVGREMEKFREKTGKDPTSKDILIKSLASSQRAGGRHHLLCQPLPLSHTKVTSVLAKVRPSNMMNTKPTSDDAARNYISSGLRPEVIEIQELPVGNVEKNNFPRIDNVALPRKRGRPPKSRETGVVDGTNSNGFEGKHFCHAPGEVSAREDNVPRKRMSLLKSSGAKSSLALVPMPSQKKTKLPSFFSGNDLQGVKKDSKFAEDMKIDVKPETLGKIKAERVSPKQGSLRDSKVKLLNGDFDLFDSEKALKGTFLQPSLGIGNLDQQDLLKRKLKSESDYDDLKGEDRKIPKLGRPPKFFCSRIKGFKLKTGFKPKQRPKASLLAYLKEKNNESDASLGETEPLPPPSSLSMIPVEEDQQKEDDPKKSPMRSSFPSYTALSIRGRRASGAGKGKCQRKPKHYHGWSWEGECHEGKVWLRNDEMWIVRKCYNAMKHKEGDTIRVRDCVLLRSGPRKTDLPFVAKVAALWEDPETCDMMMSILWYYRPEHTESGRREEDLADEIFASKHRDHLSVACIEDRCYVLTFNEYCRYRRLLRLFQERVFPPSSPVPDSDEGYLRKGRQPPGCVVHDLLFFCRKVYDYRQKRILKNPC